MRAEAEKILDKFATAKVRGRVQSFTAWPEDDNIHISSAESGDIVLPTPRQHKVNADGVALSLADFVAPKHYNDAVCLFAITIPKRLVAAIERHKQRGDDYNALLYQSVADRVVEASSEYFHRQMRYCWFFAFENYKELFAAEQRHTIPQLFAAKYRGIRPAVGYSCLPDLVGYSFSSDAAAE